MRRRGTFFKEGGKAALIIPVLLILCMLSAVIFIGVYQLRESEKDIHEETLSSLHLNAQVVSQKINDLYISLEAVAPNMAFETGLTQEQMMASMTALRNACEFDYVVRTNTDGIAFNYLGKENINLSGRRLFRCSPGTRAS